MVAAVLAAPPTLGAGRLVCVDGPAGSGKTTLAAALDRGFRDALRPPGAAADRAHVRLLHMDNVYDGWDGLDAGMATVADVGGGAAARRASRAATAATTGTGGRFAEERVVAAVRGAASSRAWAPAPRRTTTPSPAWCGWTPRPTYDWRGGWSATASRCAPTRCAWRAQEDAMFARERTRERADVVVDGTSDPGPSEDRGPASGA